MLRDNGRGKYRNISEEAKTKRQNMEEIDIIICMKKILDKWIKNK